MFKEQNMFAFSKMLKVFRDDEMQKSFEKNGFAVAPFYHSGEVEQLRDLYDRMHPKDEHGHFPSTFSKDKAYRAAADEQIRKIGERSITKYLQDVKVICGSFIVKFPGPESAMCVHQDMTLVDESKYSGINIWVPLVDLNDTNGVLQVLPGSHRIYPTYRSSTIPGIYDEVSDEIRPLLQTVYAKAGEAVFFDQSIIHYSGANISDEVRIVTNTYFTHKDAAFRIAYWNKEFGNKVELFEEDESFMTNFEQFGHNIHERPKIGKSLGLTDYNFPKITVEQLEKLYGKGNKESALQPFLKKLMKGIFN